MGSLAKLQHRHRPLQFSLDHHHQPPSYTRPNSSLSFNRQPTSLSLNSVNSSLSSEAFSLSDLPLRISKTPKTLNPSPFSLLKTSAAAVLASAAVFFARYNLKSLVATAATPPPPTAAVETAAKESISEEEKTLEEHLASHPHDLKALQDLMGTKVVNRKMNEAIAIVEKLIKLEPDDIEWPLLKAHMHCYNGELEMAKSGFNEIIEKDSLRVEAYHGLVMAASPKNSGSEMEDIEKRVKEAMEVCSREKKEAPLRDFKLLIAQIRVIEENYKEALKIYQELVKEEPRDFRPYLCQGIIYTLLEEKDEAQKQFQKYRDLVPKGHPYAQYFDDNMITTKGFMVKGLRGRVGSRS